jgi:uncharacterized protein YkwD
MLRIIPALVMLALMVVAGCAGPGRMEAQAPAPGFTGDQAEAVARLLVLHNQERLQRGLKPLSMDDRLSAAARLQATDCARRNRLTHRGGDGSGPGERASRQGFGWARIAENAAMQPRPPAGWPGDPRTPEWAVEGWMKSRGHRANLLGPFDRMGAAFADANNGTRYWVVVFARAS